MCQESYQPPQTNTAPSCSTHPGPHVRVTLPDHGHRPWPNPGEGVPAACGPGKEGNLEVFVTQDFTFVVVGDLPGGTSDKD